MQILISHYISWALIQIIININIINWHHQVQNVLLRVAWIMYSHIRYVLFKWHSKQCQQQHAHHKCSRIILKLSPVPRHLDSSWVWILPWTSPPPLFFFLLISHHVFSSEVKKSVQLLPTTCTQTQRAAHWSGQNACNSSKHTKVSNLHFLCLITRRKSKH